ncbi:MAG: efflux RND transporter periplasmic adaptor subunit [Chlorobium sp.]|jgi:RND family efflux transporter MFP subunit|nr:efflux RND transporter periplasmic adaptor subunit [Chlorobium sp.]
MKYFSLQRRTLALLVVLVPLFVLFVYVSLRSGPLAPVSVMTTTVKNRAIVPTLFGIGTVEARYTYKIGPTFSGRVKRLDVHVGVLVRAGQVLGEMDPVDLDERIRAQDASLKRVEAQLSETQARHAYAQTQARRYESLLATHSISEESVATKKLELQVAVAALNAAREELVRSSYDREALNAQRNNLHLVAPADGLVAMRYADPGTTIVAGQAVVELIDPKSLWVNVRFDQIHTHGLSAGLSTKIVLRSQASEVKGRVLWVEPLADAVTEETLAKVEFIQTPSPLPPVGELAEVTVALPSLPAEPVIPNAAIQRINGKLGVWQVINGDLRFTPITLGATDLEGQVQVVAGLKDGDQVVVYSSKALRVGSSIHRVEQLPGVKL